MSIVLTNDDVLGELLLYHLIHSYFLLALFLAARRLELAPPPAHQLKVLPTGAVKRVGLVSDEPSKAKDWACPNEEVPLPSVTNVKGNGAAWVGGALFPNKVITP